MKGTGGMPVPAERPPRGYYGVGIEGGKYSVNMGSLWRIAQSFHADFVITIGARYPMKRVRTDTSDALKHVPMFEFPTVEAFLAARSPRCRLVAIELLPTATPLSAYTHPERAIYLLGAEDRGVSDELLAQCDEQVVVEGGRFCCNVAVTAAIVLWHRIQQQGVIYG